MNPTSSSSDESHQKLCQPIPPTENGAHSLSDELPDGSEIVIGRAGSPSPLLPGFGFKIEPSMLVPPDPADPTSDETDNNDSLSLANFDDEVSLQEEEPSPRSRLSKSNFDYGDGDEERERAMKEAMNGQFKLLVRRFLEVEGILGISQEWVDIVSRISWEAGEIIKPDASQGKEMDPWSYVKVKCIASGTRHQSEVIKGLVFKKNTAHKHMPTKFANPKLLLLKGALGPSNSGLSSFDYMEEEKEHLKKWIIQTMETCQPNVIMVEKTVSRDLQELLLKDKVALVLDMKLNRLERIARCTGSPVLSFSEVSKETDLKTCERFHIERFLEEHSNNNNVSVKSKTLMFLEGFPRPLGCTILLRGANSEELKKVKRVLQYTVFAAYHLILETSFFEDQRIFLNNKNTLGDLSSVLSLPTLSNGESSQTNSNSNSNSKMLQKPKELPLLPGFYHVNGSRSMALYDAKLNSTDIHKNEELNSVKEATDTEKNEELNSLHESANVEKNEGAICRYENGGGHEHENVGCVNKAKTEGGDNSEIDNILILTTSQCVTKQMVCEQSKYNRIKYYGNTDISLGRYLQNIWHSQGQGCLSCGEPPDSHEYSYTHKNGNLTVIIKSLKPEHELSGQKEGKIWMWSRCLKCEGETGICAPTPRVLMSMSARSLSFGKFLELSFSSQTAAKRLAKCGHLLHRDCLRFFGSGSKVAVFWYTPVEVFTACKPPSILEFHNPIMRGWIKDEFRNVLPRWNKLFSEIETVLRHLKNDMSNLGPFKELSGAEDLYIKEKADFEVLFENIENSDKNEEAIHLDILGLNWLYQDLLLQTYVWDRRLHQLLQFRQENTLSLDISSGKVNGDHVDISSEEPTLSLTTGSESDQKLDLVKEPSFENSNSNQEVKLEKLGSFNSGLKEDSDKWVWNPFHESKLSFRNEILDPSIFKRVNEYKPVHLHISPLNGEDTREKFPVKFSVGPDGNILSASEDEISSIISLALSISGKSNNNNPVLNQALEKSDSATSTTSKWSSGSSFTDSDFNYFLNSQFSNLSEESVPVSLSQERHPEVVIPEYLGLKCKYHVVPICAKEFKDLRVKCCPSETEYLASMSRCKKWDPQGGKSKAFFAKTLDDRFIIKQIKRAELESFLKFEKEYFKYVNESVDSGNPSGLAKVLGIYQVRQQTKQGKELKMDLMVMENLLFGRNISRTYDLKGAIFSRHISDSDSKDSVFLDQNFIDDLRLAPFYVGVKTKHVLQRAIWNDTSFLTSINVMDYSLLVGVDKQKHELVFGIIDYLRQFTWDKQLETWVKSSLVVPKNTLPTVISPKEYKKRFRNFMIKYFLTVPDSWTVQPAENCAGPCKFCQKKISDAAQNASDRLSESRSPPLR